MSLRTTDQLSPAETAEALALIATAAAADGRPSVSEETQLELCGRQQSLRHVLASADGVMVGYGVLSTAAGPRAMLAELAVHPQFRRRGHGEAVLGSLLALAQPERLSIWAHGKGSAVAGFAETHGLRRDRVLYQMRKEDPAGTPTGSLPPPYSLRTFRPGEDEGPFLAANAATFTNLPDQGGWTTIDLQTRMDQDWFDPAGFFLAIAPDGRIAGFHWTRLHPPEPLGEIYVLGVLPDHRGRGLAAALAQRGLAHLGHRGARTAMLYVDAANAAAIALYEGLGFAIVDRDALYRS